MMRNCYFLVAFACLAVFGPVWGAEKSSVGKKIEEFKLTDFRGASHSLAEWKESDLLVVAFVGTECPLAKMYGSRLAEIAAEYEPKKVGFVAVDSNQQDTLIEMAQYARTAKIEFPFLKDPANAVADQFGAVRTPEVFVLDRSRTVRYHGRVDDQFGIGFARPAPVRKDLSVALDELLAGKEVSVASTPVAGCHVGRVNRVPPKGEITYSRQIAGIIHKNCTACHRDGEVGPFSLASYEDVVNWSSTIREVVDEGRMPPWHADAAAGTFLNDRRLSADDRKALFTWIDNGMPLGNPSEIPAPPRIHFRLGDFATRSGPGNAETIHGRRQRNDRIPIFRTGSKI